MSADTKALRLRIRSVDSTLHLTKAMELVASSKIRRATASMQGGRKYANAVRDMISLLTRSKECQKSPYMQEHAEGKTKLIVIAGDRGLAGGYNANIFKIAKEYEDADITAIGKRAFDRFKEGFDSAEHFTGKDAAAISKEVCEGFENGKFSRVGIISTEYVSMMTQNAKIEWILPLSKPEIKKSKEREADIIFEPDEITILNTAVFEYVTGIISAYVKESFACEVAARRVAMDSAGKNAQQMIDTLQISYNRARQGAITQEITEIVAGSGT